MSKLTIAKRIRKIPIQLLVILISFVAIFPIYWMFNTALTTTSEMFLDKPKLWPNSLSLGGFADVFDELEISLCCPCAKDRAARHARSSSVRAPRIRQHGRR